MSDVALHGVSLSDRTTAILPAGDAVNLRPAFIYQNRLTIPHQFTAYAEILALRPDVPLFFTAAPET